MVAECRRRRRQIAALGSSVQRPLTLRMTWIELTCPSVPLLALHDLRVAGWTDASIENEPDWRERN